MCSHHVEILMIWRGAFVFLVFSWLPDCKGEGEPGAFEKFLTPVVTAEQISSRSNPRRFEEMCTAANDGKRFWLAGYLQLPRDIRIEGGKTSLYFYNRVDGNGQGAGRPISINVTSPGDIDDLWGTATEKRLKGARAQTAKIDPDALRIRAKNGAATARDMIKLTFDITALPPVMFFETRNELAICDYQFVMAEKM